jgi:hypothetical protein
MYALFRGDKQISKAHTTKDAVAVEAFERGIMLAFRNRIELADCYEIKEVEQPK